MIRTSGVRDGVSDDGLPPFPHSAAHLARADFVSPAPHLVRQASGPPASQTLEPRKLRPGAPLIEAAASKWRRLWPHSQVAGAPGRISALRPNRPSRTDGKGQFGPVSLSKNFVNQTLADRWFFDANGATLHRRSACAENTPVLTRHRAGCCQPFALRLRSETAQPISGAGGLKSAGNSRAATQRLL